MRLSRLFALALFAVLLHTLTNGQYGFHRDELATLDDARYLAWGYVAYPPVTPFIARMALDLFGASLAGVRTRESWRATTAKPAQSISMARPMGCPKRSAESTHTGCVD